jgi:ABC-type uncharacterized transport system substrate-binding protein
MGNKGCGVVAWPVSARSQQPATPVIGFLASASPKHRGAEVAAFHRGLKEVSYVEGENVVVEMRWAEGRYDRLPGLVADLIQRQVAVIAAIGHPSLEAVKGANTTIPTVFLVGGDPVASGIVSSFGRPGGAITGVTFLANLARREAVGAAP